MATVNDDFLAFVTKHVLAFDVGLELAAHEIYSPKDCCWACQRWPHQYGTSGTNIKIGNAKAAFFPNCEMLMKSENSEKEFWTMDGMLITYSVPNRSGPGTY